MSVLTEGILVKEVHYNWFYSAENGEEYSVYSTEETYEYLGSDGKKHTYYRDQKFLAEQIIYHQPVGEGDKHFCYVRMKDGTNILVFNINKIIY